MDIKSPQRILVVGAPDCGVLGFLKDLTGSAPQLVNDSPAGLSHTLPLNTSYYTADVPIWIDEIASEGLLAWREEFLKDEAREVITVLGGWIYLFRRPVSSEDLRNVKETMAAVKAVVDRHAGYSWDGVMLAVAMQQSITPWMDKPLDEWEDMAREYGFEYIDGEAKGKNEFGEGTGMERVREALEANEWDGGHGEDDRDDFDDLDFDEDEGGDDEAEAQGMRDLARERQEWSSTFAAEEAEMGVEIMGMKGAIHGDDENEEESEEAVRELEVMMHKLQAIKDMGADMPETERKKFAARAVGKIMKTSI